MTWYEFLGPSVAVALLVRADATLIGPYWSWLELLSYFGEDTRSRRARLQSITRRVAVPGVVTLILFAVWPEQYSSWDSVLIGLGGASLLLWPMVIYGLPPGMRLVDGTTLMLYGSFLLAFGASSWTGSSISSWAAEEYGDVGEFIRAEAISILFGVVLSTFFGALWNKASLRQSSTQSYAEEYDDPA